MSDFRIRSKLDVPELSASHAFLRISPDINVPLTPRVKRLIDSTAFRRLSRISQLGLVSFVYPGATHSRMEHSLGVYRNAIDFVNRLEQEPSFESVVSSQQVELFLVAGLLHDLGHWPFCHAIEDMRMEGIERHEAVASRLIHSEEIALALREDWGLSPEMVCRFLKGPSLPNNSDPKQDYANGILQSLLSGPIDIDKIDYLERDSLHAGVPYGKNFDRHRLIQSLCINPSTGKLAITDKGRTAAEMMVFARYIMFSEVYWHHAVRSATAMLQRAVHELQPTNQDTSQWLHFHESQMIDWLLERSANQSWRSCIDGLFGPKRKLFKRVAQFDCNGSPQQHQALARRPYAEIVELSKKLARTIHSRFGIPLGEHDLLIDAPPQKLEVQFQIDVKQSEGHFRSLGELSPVVHALATRQFDDIVKRVRIFANPEFREALTSLPFECLIDELVS
jgi:uncharacterized protein